MVRFPLWSRRLREDGGGKTLLHAQNEYGEKGKAVPVNPKAVSRNELYGFLHPATASGRKA